MRASTRLTLAGGLYASLIGYATVVVLVAILDAALGRSPFYTAALFGSAMFYGPVDPATLVVSPGPVLAFNMVHLFIFLGLGFLASWLVAIGERVPTAQYFLLVVLLFVAFHVYGGLLLFAQPLLGRRAWWVIGGPGVVAAVLMGWYLLRAHPFLRAELKGIPMGEVPPEV